MSISFDLDGSLQAEQWGLVADACRRALTAAVTSWLMERDVEVIDLSGNTQQWLASVGSLEAVAPYLADEAWELFLAPVGDGGHAREHTERVLDFIRGRLGCDVDVEGSEQLRTWATSAEDFQEACVRLGLPRPDWYLTGATGASDAWVNDALRYVGGRP
jgi:hypothetical protein